MRVLVVEDDPQLNDLLKSLVEQQGYACDTAADGEEGRFCAMEYPIDLAIVDLGLPKLDGIELIKSLRAVEKTFPILILTARDRWQSHR